MGVSPIDKIEYTIEILLQTLRDMDYLSQVDVQGISEILRKALQRRQQEKIVDSLDKDKDPARDVSQEEAEHLFFEGVKNE